MFSIRRLSYLILVTCAAFGAHVFFYQSQSHWIVWTVLPLLLIPFNIAFLPRLKIAMTSGLIFILCIFVASNLRAEANLAILFLTLLTFICVLASLRFPKWFLPILMINLFSIVAYLTSNTVNESISRSLFALLGVIIVCVAQLIFWPSCFRFEILANMRALLREFVRLNNEIFSCFLDSAYKDNIYLFERRLHKQKNRSMLMLQQFGNIVLKKSETFSHFNQLFNKIYDLMIDAAQLRWRVSDATTFHVCHNELLSIAEEFENIFHELAQGLHRRKYYLDIMGLNEKIKRLEENYQHVLQIAAREPLVFLLFITSLKELSIQIQMIYECMLRANLVENQKEHA